MIHSVFPLGLVFFSVTVLVALVLRATLPKLTDAGESDTDAGAATATSIVIVWVRSPEVPVTATVVAGPVIPPAVTVIVLVEVAGFGLKAAVAPLGKPVADNVTLPANPLYGVIMIALVACPPYAAVKISGLAASV